MKVTSLLMAIGIIASNSQLVSAKGERGAIERCILLASYMSETALGPSTDGYKIAPGCGAHFATDRCSLTQLLSYLWAPEEGQLDSRRPGPDDLLKNSPAIAKLNDESPKKWTTVRLFQAINTYVEKHKGEKRVILTGNLDFNRAMPDATDFYDMVSKSADPIKRLDLDIAAKKAAAPPVPVPDGWQEIVDRGKEGTKSLVFLRLEDFDQFRLNMAKGNFGDAYINRPELKDLKEGNPPLEIRYTEEKPPVKGIPAPGKGQPEEKKLFNLQLTIDKYVEAGGDGALLRQKLLEAHNNMMAETDPLKTKYRDHIKAIQAAQVARGATSCDGPDVNIPVKRAVAK
ncbi:hypothetical protein H072_515 [Dactylellina haptotyla CBS 200.50]|uniref:Uncharacterized protein n=1 Tax=Dactylellina haptotyla (strain CBS 200.50) TaxID=1284197 RepID=S8CCY4_DACHA|nr:hypothetical protein H072_515 [Dactylellina haptotyla CBS 200.50]